MMLTDGELNWARDYIQDVMMPGTAVIKRDSGSVNTYYEYAPSESAVGTVACRIDPYSRFDGRQEASERDASRNWYRLTLPHDVDVQSDDIVTIAGVDYSIVQLHEGHDENFVVRLIVAKVD